MRHAGDPVTLSEGLNSVNKAFIFATDGGDDVEQILRDKPSGPHKIIDSGHWPMTAKPEEVVAKCYPRIAGQVPRQLSSRLAG